MVCTVQGLSSPRLRACSAPSLPKKTFAKAQQVTSARDGAYNFEPTAVLAKTGDLAVAFMRNERNGPPRGTYGLSTTLLHADGTIEPPVPFDGGKETHFDPWMATGRGGRLALVWLGFEGTAAPERSAEIGFATSADGKRWSIPKRVDDHARDCRGELGCYDKPMIAIGPDKKHPGSEAIYVFYLTNTGGGLKVVKSVDGGVSFGQSVMVREDGGWGSVHVAPSGAIHLAYMYIGGRVDLFGDTKTVIEHAQSDDGGSTFVHHVVSLPGEPIPMFFANPQVVSDEARGLLYVVYPTGGRDGRWEIRLATSRDGGATFTHVQVNDDAPCGNHAAPQAVLDPSTGKLHVTWLENRSGAGGLAYASCEVGGGRCSANEAVNDTPFASYVLTRHSPRWMAEYGSLIVDPTTRRLHSVWTEPVNENGQPTARIFHAVGQL